MNNKSEKNHMEKGSFIDDKTIKNKVMNRLVHNHGDKEYGEKRNTTFVLKVFNRKPN